MKDALGHGSNSRGGGNWQSGYLAAQRAHDVGGAINPEPHSAGVHALPKADGTPGGRPLADLSAAGTANGNPGGKPLSSNDAALANAMRALAGTHYEQARARKLQSGMSDADLRGMI